MRIQEIELSVGEVLEFGGQSLTVLDIENGEVLLRIESGEEGGAAEQKPLGSTRILATLPR